MEIKEAVRKLSGAKRQKALVLKERIEALEKELNNLLTEVTPTPLKRMVQRHKKLKSAVRKKIGATLKAGLSKVSGKKPS